MVSKLHIYCLLYSFGFQNDLSDLENVEDYRKWSIEE